MRVGAYIHTRIPTHEGSKSTVLYPSFWPGLMPRNHTFCNLLITKQRSSKEISAVFGDFFTLWGNILPYTYRGQRDGRSGCTAISRHLFSSLSDAYELPDTSFHAFATCCTREVLDCNKNCPHLCFSSKHKRGNDDAGCCAVPACCREGTGTIAQVVAECRLPSEGWRLLRIRANGIGWRRAPSCARCAWS